MKDFTCISHRGELSDFIIITKYDEYKKYQLQCAHYSEDIEIKDNKIIKISLQAPLYPMNFTELNNIVELRMVTLIKDEKSGKDLNLIRVITDVKYTIKYTGKCDGTPAIITIAFEGTLSNEFLDTKETKEL